MQTRSWILLILDLKTRKTVYKKECTTFLSEKLYYYQVNFYILNY